MSKQRKLLPQQSHILARDMGPLYYSARFGPIIFIARDMGPLCLARDMCPLYL